MCTLILGYEVLGPRSVLLGANRDEDPARASEPPRILSQTPHLAGGRDAVAGGTWLAVRESLGVVALLNRRPSPATDTPAAPRRSRGLLTLEVAAATLAPGETFARAAWRTAEAAFASDAYAPCTLLLASPEGCWAASRRDGTAVEFAPVPPGWHVITHADLDDPGEPRTRWLLEDLAGFAPTSPEQAIEAVQARLRLHAGDREGAPEVCIHDGRMVTVSSAVVLLGRDRRRYLHVEGRACTGARIDATALLSAPRAAQGDL